MITSLLTLAQTGRGLDLEEHSMEELFDILTTFWPSIPIALGLIFFSWLILKNRDQDPWFCFDNEDRWYTKIWIVILWIVTIIAALLGVYTLFQIILRILLGAIVTFLEWVLLWLASIFVLLLATCLPSLLIYATFEQYVQWLAKLLAIVSFIGTILLIIYFWDTIPDWKWFFPKFPSFDIYEF